MPDLANLATLHTSLQTDVTMVVELDSRWTPSLTGLYYFMIKNRPTNESATTVIRARIFHFPNGEDPCTGSAACTLACHLSLLDGMQGKTYAYLIEQGIEMGRSGELHVKVKLDETIGGSIYEVVLARRAVVAVTDGKLTLPTPQKL